MNTSEPFRRTVIAQLHRSLTLVVTCGLLVAAGCESMPPASGPETIQVLAALRTALSIESPDRLQEVAARIERLYDAEQITLKEYKVMQGIIDTARGGDWESALQHCSRFQKAQIR